MPKPWLLIIPIVITALVFALVKFRHPSPASTVKVVIKNQPFNLEIARTISQKAKGLSNRSSLCPNCGMIFVYTKDQTLPFWMKDTLIPLDMIWVNSQGKVVSIQTATPQTGTPDLQLAIFRNDRPARFVIELNAGNANKIGLKIGDNIDIPPL